MDYSTIHVKKIKKTFGIYKLLKKTPTNINKFTLYNALFLTISDFLAISVIVSTIK